MNMYLIPVTESYGYNYDYFELIIADSCQDAYDNLSEVFKSKYIDDRIISKNFDEYSIQNYNNAYHDRILNLTRINA